MYLDYVVYAFVDLQPEASDVGQEHKFVPITVLTLSRSSRELSALSVNALYFSFSLYAHFVVIVCDSLSMRDVTPMWINHSVTQCVRKR
jgi:hypothetical protein